MIFLYFIRSDDFSLRSWNLTNNNNNILMMSEEIKAQGVDLLLPALELNVSNNEHKHSPLPPSPPSPSSLVHVYVLLVVQLLIFGD